MSITRYIFIWGAMLFTSTTMAQDEGFIYGTVTTISGNEYTGQLRWGGEEIYWTDQFNATKLSNKIYGHIIDQKKEKKGESIFDMDWSLSGIWEDKGSGTVHLFSCGFGDLKQLEKLENSQVKLTLRNGTKIKVGGSGYNDINASISIQDTELGLVKVSSGKVRKVDFKPTPAQLSDKMGEAIYGKLITLSGDTFEGILQWDKQERITSDILDGYQGDEKLKIAFKSITRLEPNRTGCEVTLRSGRKLIMKGTNDVDGRNRGTIVTVDGVGRIEVDWEQIDQVDINHGYKGSGKSYAEFVAPKGLFGTVTTLEGKTHSGRLAFDLDEVWEFETIDGKKGENEYQIPMGNIRSVTPKNRAYSLLELQTGERLLLGKKRDVNDQNDGMLIFPVKEQEPVFVKWYEVDNVQFD